MGLLNTVENLDDIKEDFKQYYTEKDGKFELSEELRSEDISPLKNALERQKADRIASEKKAKELQDKIDSDAIALAEAKGNKEEADKLIQVRLDKQKIAHEKELIEVKKLNHELTIGMTRDSIASEVYLKSDAWKMTDMESRIKLSDDGKTTYLVNSLGETVNRKDFIENLRSDESMLFAIRGSKSSGGGGDSSGDNNNSSHSTKKFGDMTTQEQVAHLKSKR